MARIHTNAADLAVEIRQQSALTSDSVSYMGHLLVQMTLPHADPGDIAEYTRRSGNLDLTIQPAPRLGYPYGVIPRLALSWLSKEVVVKKEQRVLLGDSLSAFMNRIGIDARGGKRGSIEPVRQQTARLFGSRIAVVRSNEQVYALKPIQIADVVDVKWWESAVLADNQRSLFVSSVVLSDAFYRMLSEHPVPVDERALQFLRSSSLALDLYMWLTYRMFSLKHETSIPWELLHNQFGGNYQETKYFTRAAKRQLKKIQQIWPRLKLAHEHGVLILKPSAPHVPVKSRFVQGR